MLFWGRLFVKSGAMRWVGSPRRPFLSFPFFSFGVSTDVVASPTVRLFVCLRVEFFPTFTGTSLCCAFCVFQSRFSTSFCTSFCSSAACCSARQPEQNPARTNPGCGPSHHASPLLLVVRLAVREFAFTLEMTANDFSHSSSAGTPQLSYSGA